MIFFREELHILLPEIDLPDDLVYLVIDVDTTRIHSCMAMLGRKWLREVAIIALRAPARGSDITDVPL